MGIVAEEPGSICSGVNRFICSGFIQTSALGPMGMEVLYATQRLVSTPLFPTATWRRSACISKTQQLAQPDFQIAFVFPYS